MLNIDEVTHHYAICALWSSTDEEGEPLDSVFTVDDIAPETMARMRSDCEAFTADYADLIAQTCMDAAQCGHDLWLTRNRHGAGFWDRGYPDAIGQALTEGAHLMGGVDLYAGEDGWVREM